MLNTIVEWLVGLCDGKGGGGGVALFGFVDDRFDLMEDVSKKDSCFGARAESCFAVTYLFRWNRDRRGASGR